MKVFNLRTQIHVCRSIRKLKRIHGVLLQQGLSQHQPLSCALMDTYAKHGNPLYAHSVFLQIENPDIVSWTSLISLHLHTGRPSLGFAAFSRLVLEGHKPDYCAAHRAISACWRSRNVSGAMAVHAIILRFHLGSHPPINSSLIDMYSRLGKIEAAHSLFRATENRDVICWTTMLNGFILCREYESSDRLFEEMPEKNLISWTSMISGCVRRGSPVRALKLYRDMKAEGGHHPTDVTVCAVLAACADIGALDLGKSFHGYAEKCNLSNAIAVNNTLIDMYSKSGNLKAAEEVFWVMPDRDTFSWTTIISSFAYHGKGTEALEVFSKMTSLGQSPNDVTFVSLLSACSHGGLIIHGREIFSKMINQYGIQPRLAHYGCMVDILGRAGRLEEAKALVEAMPIRPDAVIWRSILGFSVLHGNIKMAELAGEIVMKLEPENDSVYVLLWNLYYAANMPEQALDIKKRMRSQSIKKKPGCSWLEVNGTVHEFLVEDVSAVIRSALDAMKEHSKLDLNLIVSEDIL